MWCFFDESYPKEGGLTAIVACLMQSQTVRKLDREMFLARKNNFDEKNARDPACELKGQSLLSSTSFKYAEKYGNSKNHQVVRDIFDACTRMRSRHQIFIFGAVVYGARDLLTNMPDGKLVKPLTSILNCVSAAACGLNRRDRVNLVFDEQIGTRAAVAERIRRFVSGVRLRNVSHYPLSAVSTTSPGVQLADIGAFILGRQAVGDPEFMYWMTRLRDFEWRGRIEGRKRRGIGIFSRANGVITRRSAWPSRWQGQ